MEWQKQTTTFDHLKKKSKGFPAAMSMLTWLRLIGVIPLTVEWRRGNRLPNTNLNPDAIQAGYLAELAVDWDKDGRTTPADFLEALSFEISGTRNKQELNKVLSELAEGSSSWRNSYSVS